MPNTNFKLPVLIVLLALTLCLIRAQVHSSSEPSTPSSSAADMPDIVKSFLAKKFNSKTNAHEPSRPRSLKNKLDFFKIKSGPLAQKFNKKGQHSQKYSQSASNNIITEPIIGDTQYKFVIVNETAVITASETNYWTFTLNLINLVDKSKISQVFTNLNISQSQLAMKLFDQNTLFVYIKDRFLVVNVANLTIRQTILFSEQPKVSNNYGDLYYIENYVKNESGAVQNTVVVGYQGVIAQVLEYNYQTNQYMRVNQAFKPMGDFYLTSPNSGVSFWNTYRVPSPSLRQNYRIFDKQLPKKYQNSEVYIVSNSQQLVATTYQSPYYYYHIQILSLNKSSYQLTERYTVDLPTKLSCNSDKIRFTDDGKYLFVNFKQVYEQYRTVGVLDVDKGKIKYFDYDGENFSGPLCFDYGIVDAGRFVIICQGVKGQQMGVGSYQLRLYELNSFKLLDTYSIDAEATDLQIKTNPNFNSNLILQIFNNPKNNQDRPPTLKLFKVVNNKLTLSSIPPTLTNLTIVTDCLSYLIGIFNNEPYHSFVNINTFETIKKTQRYDLSDRYDIYGSKNYYVQNNILGICNNKYYFGKCEMYQFYDLAKIGAAGDQWRLCYFFMETWMNFYYYLHQEQRVVTRAEYGGTVKAFDLQKCPTKTLTDISIPPQQQSYSRKVLYKRSQSCNTAYLFYVSNTIFTFKDCQPLAPPTKTTIRPSSQYQFLIDIMMSSNNKYLILLICSIDPNHPLYCRFRYDVRSVDDLAVSLYKTGIVYCYVQKEENCLADVSDKGDLLYLTQDGLFLEAIRKKEEKGERRQKGKEYVGLVTE